MNFRTNYSFNSLWIGPYIIKNTYDERNCECNDANDFKSNMKSFNVTYFLFISNNFGHFTIDFDDSIKNCIKFDEFACHIPTKNDIHYAQIHIQIVT